MVCGDGGRLPLPDSAKISRAKTRRRKEFWGRRLGVFAAWREKNDVLLSDSAVAMQQLRVDPAALA